MLYRRVITTSEAKDRGLTLEACSRSPDAGPWPGQMPAGQKTPADNTAIRPRCAFVAPAPASNPQGNLRLSGMQTLGRFRDTLRGRDAWIGFFALVDQAIVSGLRFLTTVVIGRLCGAGELGMYALASSLMLITLAVQDSFVLGPYTVLGSQFMGARKASYLGAVLLEGLVLTALAIGALVAVAAALVVMSSASALGNTIGVLAAALPFILLHNFGRRFAFAELNTRSAILLDGTTAALQLGGLTMLALGGALSGPAVFGVIGIASALPGLAWLFKTRKAMRFCLRDIPGDLHRNWRLGRWMLASQVVSALAVYVIGWLLAWRVGVTATGVYAACASLAGLMNPILLGMNNVLLPRVAMAFAEGAHAAVRRLSRKALALVVGPTATIAVGLVVCAPRLLSLLYGPSYAPYYHVAGVLAIATVLNAVGLAANLGLLAMERSEIGFVAQLAGLCAAVAAALALIPYFGIAGAACGALLGTAVTAAVLLVAHECLTNPVRVTEDTRGIVRWRERLPKTSAPATTPCRAKGNRVN